MEGNTGAYVVFGLGILVGLILGNKSFRVKLFTGLRRFLGQVGKGARHVNDQYSGGKAEEGQYSKRTLPSERVTREEPKVQHIYRRVHTDKTCPVCSGSGRVFRKPNPLQAGAPGYKPTPITCPTCEGEGKVWD